MNQTLPEDQLDNLLGDFFKAQMKTPWPAAPATAPVSTPATAPAPAERPHKQPARRDTGSKARVTLAASFALLLGTCWYLSNGFTPGQHSAPVHGGSNILNGSSAGNPDAIKELHKDNAIKGNHGITPPKVDMIDLP